ncbi:MAG: NAD(+) synthase [bacterium]|nr:NAD(+) synthase [bacterium]
MSTAIKLKNFDLLPVAVAVPRVKVGNIDFNLKQIVELAGKADKAGAALVLFPELAITGYTAADLFHQRLLIENVATAVKQIEKATERIGAVLVVGAPVEISGKLFNCGLVISGGRVRGIVPKSYIPGYKEFYEERWFSAARDLQVTEISWLGKKIPVGTDLLFRISEKPEVVLGVEICEDLWTPVPPSSLQVLHGANVIVNLSASNDLVGKSEYRRDLVVQQSARGICGYLYSSCGTGESTTDVVFGGHAMIAENGSLLCESKRFSRENELIFSEIDLGHIVHDRAKMTSFSEGAHEFPEKAFRLVEALNKNSKPANLTRWINPAPFVPGDPAERDKRSEEIFSIQAAGLAKRLEQVKHQNLIIGLSGGLDSTLAVLVAVKAADLLRLPRKNIHALTMPGFATTKRTKSNAVKLAEALGAYIETIDITKGAERQLKDIGHDLVTQDLAFENAQARYRTMTLMDRANQVGGIVVGTGDLSEIALGWNTFTGDQISHYGVNAGVPKTLVKYLVEWASEQKEFRSAQEVLRDIVATPISPELVKPIGNKEITQKTEDIIGPYELHDFFLYHLVRWGSSPSKVLFLAERAFGAKYSKTVLKKWLTLFVTRFFANQWKRSVMPDGPKVGSVVLSPRGDWRMPSDADAELWLKDIK